jgi:hypothetical protein
MSPGTPPGGYGAAQPALGPGAGPMLDGGWAGGGTHPGATGAAPLCGLAVPWYGGVSIEAPEPPVDPGNATPHRPHTFAPVIAKVPQLSHRNMASPPTRQISGAHLQAMDGHGRSSPRAIRSEDRVAGVFRRRLISDSFPSPHHDGDTQTTPPLDHHARLTEVSRGQCRPQLRLLEPICRTLLLSPLDPAAVLLAPMRRLVEGQYNRNHLKGRKSTLAIAGPHGTFLPAL